MSALNGRPKGARDKPPGVSTRAAKRALEAIRQRAEQGSPEDQRILYLGYIADRLPFRSAPIV